MKARALMVEARGREEEGKECSGNESKEHAWAEQEREEVKGD